MSIDSHTENEASTLTFAILKDLSTDIAENFAKSAFPQKQARENAETTLNSLTPNFISRLIASSLPKTTYPSIIYNSTTFKDKENKRTNMMSTRLKHIFLSHRIVGHTRSVHHLCLDPLNILFFSGSDDTNIKCWHIPSLSLIITFKGHVDNILGMCMSPDRRLFASFSNDKTIRLWSLLNGACVALIYSQEIGEITTIAFSPCNRFLAIGSKNGSVRFLRIAPLIPILARAADIMETHDGKIPKTKNMGDLLFPDGESYSTFINYDPMVFIKTPPTNHMLYSMKSEVNMVSFSSGGNFAACALETGDIVVVCTTTHKRWSFPCHDSSNSCDGVMFLKNNFHKILSWSQKGGDIKLWSFNDKIRSELLNFSVRYQSRRAHLIEISLNCNETLLCACTSSSIFVWKIDNTDYLLHVDDPSVAAGCTGINFHPKLPNIFLVSTKANIMIWDVNFKEPIHILNIPIETHRIQSAKWGPDGLSVFAGDAGGGIYFFRILDGPDCRTIPEFFDSDFEPSEWKPEIGQVDELQTPTHMLNKSIITDSERVKIAVDFEPMTLEEVEVIPYFESQTKYAWLNEELWLKSTSNSSTYTNETKPPRPPPKSREIIIDDYVYDEEILMKDSSDSDAIPNIPPESDYDESEIPTDDQEKRARSSSDPNVRDFDDEDD